MVASLTTKRGNAMQSLHSHNQASNTPDAPRFVTPENVAHTMSGTDLLALVNEARKEFGEAVIRANVFAERIKDELDGEHYKSFVVQNLNNTLSTVFELTRDQCMLVSMRESKAVRRKVLDRLNARPSLPSFAETLRLYADQIEQTERVTVERDHAVATKALIGSKREATAMATASSAVREASKLRDQLGVNERHATIIAVERATGLKFPKNSYVALRRWCKAHDVEPTEVVDPRYGTVKAWPAAAWREAHAIDLSDVFGGVAA